MTYYDGDGTYSYAFAFNMDEAESRTFRVSASDDFEPWPEEEVFGNDPINYYTDPTELKTLFATAIPGVSSAEILEDSGNFSFIRLMGDGKGAKEVSLNVLQPRNDVSSGKYIVLKYRIPSGNKTSNIFQFFISTVNVSAKQGDDVIISGDNILADDKWHVVIVDVSSYLTDTFAASSSGEYFAKYMRFDVFNAPLGETEYIDIAYVGTSATIKKLCELNSDTETMLLLSSNKTEEVNVATGEIKIISQSGPPSAPLENEGVTMSKDPASFIDPSNEQNYKVSDVLYFGRIDTLNGYGPAGVLELAYNAKGSNNNIGVATFKYDNITTRDHHLVFAGWSLIYGGVEKYVWSADGGKTWHDITLYNRDSISTAGEGMIKYANQAFGKSDFNLYAANSAYQGPLNGPGTCSGLGADLSAYVGETINVTFAAVPTTDPDGLCILLHVTGVSVPAN
jgi:hypothetical protein